MASDKGVRMAQARGEPVRQRVLDAAERLLREGKAEFSMRELAAEAGVSFATPFNQFGNKAAIMHALSDRRIDAMTERFVAASRPADRNGRVLRAVEIAVSVMVEEPQVNRAVMGWIGSQSPAAGRALARSTALWTMALTGDRDEPTEGQMGTSPLAERLAIAFRGALSFWTAGELSDDALRSMACGMANALLSSTD